MPNDANSVNQSDSQDEKPEEETSIMELSAVNSWDAIIKPVNELGFGWVDVAMYMTDTKTRANPSVHISMPIRYGRDWTIQQIEDHALSAAREVIDSIGLHWPQEEN